MSTPKNSMSISLTGNEKIKHRGISLCMRPCYGGLSAISGIGKGRKSQSFIFLGGISSSRMGWPTGE